LFYDTAIMIPSGVTVHSLIFFCDTKIFFVKISKKIFFLFLIYGSFGFVYVISYESCV